MPDFGISVDEEHIDDGGLEIAIVADRQDARTLSRIPMYTVCFFLEGFD